MCVERGGRIVGDCNQTAPLFCMKLPFSANFGVETSQVVKGRSPQSHSPESGDYNRGKRGVHTPHAKPDSHWTYGPLFD